MAAAVAPLLATIIGSFGSGDRRHRTPSFHELRSYVAGGDQNNNKEVELLHPADDGSGDGGQLKDATWSSSSEVEEARCECCGMSEECTPAYIGAVRRRFSGRWVCGLCAEAVAEEAAKNGGDREAALAAHVAVCTRFNGFGRTHPALFQADAVIGIMRKLSGGLGSPRSPTGKSTSKAADVGVAGSMALVNGC
ncbi:hypothetical protein PR202_gb06670 [Eleusine coracana subsp. coracana]|uniref:DUF1677 family protein n=1 Tax=Eleusine coracana subsp. coracana TaxID=191504 RepID=A0AAV5EA77_ELECO|nr:hypothetical protein QOZ80_2BG0160600 [Eleusine coracana subsp. coracana]GJN19395.1 hypothetical protein PR202_gb06670 [Eleusine coracana subsp. coracana]